MFEAELVPIPDVGMPPPVSLPRVGPIWCAAPLLFKLKERVAGLPVPVSVLLFEELIKGLVLL